MPRWSQRPDALALGKGGPKCRPRPNDLFAQPINEPNFRDIPECTANTCEVCFSTLDITQLGRLPVDYDLTLHDSAERCQYVEDCGAEPACNIEHLSGNACFHRGHRGRDGVCHKGEISGLRPVPVEYHRLTRVDRTDEPGDSHVGSLPGTVDGEVPEGYRREAAIRVIREAQLLRRQLGHAVRRHWPRQIVFRGCVVLALAVYRRRGGENQLLQPSPSHRLQQPLRCQDIALQMEQELRTPTRADARLTS